MIEAGLAKRADRAKPRGGRPTRAAALERDERLLAIAADMFMEYGFDGTSMERLAETAMVGKATLYARYADKGALFADVLRRKIIVMYATLESEFGEGLADQSLEATLLIVARRLLDVSLSPQSIALKRILTAQSLRFPELGRLVVEEGLGRQTELLAGIFRRFAPLHRYTVDDLSLLAELYLSIVMGWTSRLSQMAVPIDPVALDRRVQEAVKLFIRGAVVANS